MASLQSLELALGQVATAASSKKQPLSDAQYSAGLSFFTTGSGWATYQKFIIPQLSKVLAPLFKSRSRVSVLEIGPGPKSVLAHLPRQYRQKIKRYVAYEPNKLFATNLQEWLSFSAEGGPPLPCLESLSDIRRVPFVLGSDANMNAPTNDGDEKFDIVLFCHSMYGMKPQRSFIERALEMLVEQPGDGMVVVFHQAGVLHFDGLVCHRTASFPTGDILVADEDKALDSFAPFIAGFIMKNVGEDIAVRKRWREVCRALGRRKEGHPYHLHFSAPEVMMAFTRHATALPDLAADVPLMKGEKKVKNREVRLHRPAAIARPRQIRHVQQCVQWALKHGASLTVVSGGHSGQCLWSDVVAVDMEAFDQVHILTAGGSGSGSGSLVVAEAGCKTGDIIRNAMEVGLTVPLGSRPSVGAGLWLQGGIGHLARQHGLASDAIVGAVVVSLDSGKVLCIGQVPSEHCPDDAVRPDNESDLLWAIKGAGTNFGIVVSVTFKAFNVSTYTVRSWNVPLSDDDNLDPQQWLKQFNVVAKKLPDIWSADAYLYWEADQLHLGVTMYESQSVNLNVETPTCTPLDEVLGPQNSFKVVDGVGLFDTEMYMSAMHGGHGGGKTSSFKRCLFIKDIGAVDIANVLIEAIATRPSALSYLHLIHSGGAVANVAANATAFGCRDWEFACVITGVWPRDQYGTDAAQSAVKWVYGVAEKLLPLSSGVYGADLGPDPRDAALATNAFGPNLPRLARLKRDLDPQHVLASACPLPKIPMEPELIILVTGESCAGKDYCANVWASVLSEDADRNIKARAVSISDETKREYAAATGADLLALLNDRAYKEQHRPALTEFFQEQVRQRAKLPEEHFMNVVYGAADVDVLLITGMRDEAPVAAFSQLVPDSRLLEVRVEASNETKRARRGGHCDDDGDCTDRHQDFEELAKELDCPSLIFDNNAAGDEAAESFSKQHLFPLLHKDMQRLADMVRPIPNFPRQGIEFQHVLDISQQPGGLALCSSLLQTHFSGDWTKVGAIACCEAGGFVFASALSVQVDVPLLLIRENGKLPPPTISVDKSPSHISSHCSGEKKIAMDRDMVSRGASVVVMDDVLATGETLCAVLQLLVKNGVNPGDVSVMVVAEFPAHGGRQLLHRRGFGRVNVQSLLVFGGL
ncbi:hypothetical protein TRIATDRAFT_92606 [Trichoderma atroviride IMI 206040]|uniref:FAD-binding PCMH-type domain-containing protein n=1 Tax=Hypocrea atroviridis (strain ATCC 20476 / IMI 206040) TaxID=452589 RepID=G9NIE5_HYPAI|nr:uncharacterized protein TRIATDRAFT_92606 [Trichoderma atroviride IMI 206040]EHK49558.1 hypothetical protein TRIATDRAFT_92606 [Trichoderma atroviride IMI 206040]